MIKKPMNKSQAGFTLIEVLLALMLGVIVMDLAFNFYSQGQTIYTKAQNQVDAQSQLRLEMNQIKRELSVATNVEISDAPGSYEVGFFYFYVNSNTMVIKEGTSLPKALPGCLPLPGLEVFFSKSPHQVNLVRVHMISAEGAELNSDILTQNTGAIVGDTTERTTIKFKRIN